MNFASAQKRDVENSHPFMVMRQHLTTNVTEQSSQDTTAKSLKHNWLKSHRAFVSSSMCWTPGSKIYTSAEAGLWGTSSSTSFSIVSDFITVDRKFECVVGPKAYYTSHESPTLSYMFYVSPKLNLATRSSLLEYGVIQNYIISKDIIIGVALGNQLFEDSSRKTFFQIGAVYLFTNK